jgi:uncharacterized membrane protein
MSSIPTIAICVIGALHLSFMIGELYPWESPWIMNLVRQKWPKKLNLSHNDTDFVSMAVHNAGIYNGIVAAGLFSAAYVGSPAFHVQVTLLVGGIVAGLFGAKTLSKLVIGQAIAGVIALAIVWFHGP